MRNSTRNLGLAVALALGITACGGDGDEPSAQSTAASDEAGEESAPPETEESVPEESAEPEPERSEAEPEADGSESAAVDPAKEAEPAQDPEEAEEATGISALPSVALMNVIDGGETDLAELGTGDTPILFWFYAPH